MSNKLKTLKDTLKIITELDLDNLKYDNIVEYQPQGIAYEITVSYLTALIKSLSSALNDNNSIINPIWKIRPLSNIIHDTNINTKFKLLIMVNIPIDFRYIDKEIEAKINNENVLLELDHNVNNVKFLFYNNTLYNINFEFFGFNINDKQNPYSRYCIVDSTNPKYFGKLTQAMCDINTPSNWAFSNKYLSVLNKKNIFHKFDWYDIEDIYLSSDESICKKYTVKNIVSSKDAISNIKFFIKNNISFLACNYKKLIYTICIDNITYVLGSNHMIYRLKITDAKTYKIVRSALP